MNLEPENKKSADIKKFMAPSRLPKKTAIRKADVAAPTEKPALKDKAKIIGRIRFSKKGVAIGIFALFLLGALGTAGYYFYQYKKATASNNEVADYVAKIGKYMILPTDETPTVATVADKDKLSGQPFFANAQNGDKVLFYTKAQKAILYRPSINKIVEAASMSGGAPSADNPGSASAIQTGASAVQNSAQTPPATAAATAQTAAPAASDTPADSKNTPAPAPEAPKTAVVAIYNGTTTKGIAKSISGKISAIEGVSVASTGNAKDNYPTTTVIDLSGNKGDLAQNIASAVGGTVGSLPAGETAPTGADILIIGGADYKL